MHKNQFPMLVRRLTAGWLVAATLEYLLLPEQLRFLESLSGIAAMSFPRLLTVTVLITVLLCCFKTEKGERLILPVCWLIFASSALRSSFSVSFLVACLLVLAVLTDYGFFGWNGRNRKAKPNTDTDSRSFYITLSLTLSVFGFICLWTICRIWNYNTPTYDFGLFSQMFHYMKETGQPLTTLERDGLLSHFAVHVSPIYYLMLPAYILFPYPETLQIQQAAVMVSAVIPLWKLGKHRGLSPKQRMLLCGILLFYPAFTAGAGYDLHENCFLAPCLLWVFYGIERKWGLVTAVSTFLTLMIKEDAPVYTAVIGLWLLLASLLHKDRWGKGTGAFLFLISLAWFLCTTSYLSGSGDGVMTGRYDNFIYDGSGSLLAVIKAVLLCPMKLLWECADPEKLEFLALTTLPLLGLPLLTRRYEDYILLIPYILVNLMPDYRYQHDIFFQYTFGSTACLIYLTMCHLPKKRTVSALLAAVLVAASCFSYKVVPKAMDYPLRCIRNYDRNQSIHQLLSQIPQDASASASTFYTVPLSARPILYDVEHSSPEHILSTQYVLLSKNDESFAPILLDNGYTPIAQIEDVLTLYFNQEMEQK